MIKMIQEGQIHIHYRTVFLMVDPQWRGSATGRPSGACIQTCPAICSEQGTAGAAPNYDLGAMSSTVDVCVGSAVRLLAIFCAATLPAAVFLYSQLEPEVSSQSSLVEYTNARSSPSPQPPPPAPSRSQSGPDQPPSRQVRVIPLPRPEDVADPETNGSAPEQAEEAPKTKASCHMEACSKAYSSFDEETCTYQPYRGPRRLCRK